MANREKCQTLITSSPKPRKSSISKELFRTPESGQGGPSCTSTPLRPTKNTPLQSPDTPLPFSISPDNLHMKKPGDATTAKSTEPHKDFHNEEENNKNKSLLAFYGSDPESGISKIINALPPDFTTADSWALTPQQPE